MRIFFICQRVPFPPDRGDKITTFNEIRHLSTKHQVHIFCLADGKRDLDNIPGLQRYTESVTAVPVNGWKSKLRALEALFFGGPLSVAAFNEAKLYCHHAKIYRAETRADHGLQLQCRAICRAFFGDAADNAIRRARFIAVRTIRGPLMPAF